MSILHAHVCVYEFEYMHVGVYVCCVVACCSDSDLIVQSEPVIEDSDPIRIHVPECQNARQFKD